MSRDGSGGYSLPANNFSVAASGNTATDTDANAVWADIVAAIAQSVSKDGQTTMTGALKMGAQKITGLAVGTANTDGLTLGQAQNGAFRWGGVAGGTADALTLSLSPAITAYVDGMTVLFVSGASPNTGAATANVNTVGADAILKNGVALQPNDIQPSKVYAITSYNSDWHLWSPLGGTANFTNLQIGGASVLSSMRGHIAGLTLANNGSDAVNDIDIAAGAATASDQSALIVLGSALVKRLDASWAVGTNQGMLDGTESVAGTPDVSTWYHIWLIRRSDTGVVDVLASESATSPTMPTNYDQKRRIGAVFNNSSGNIDAFTQIGDDFMWSTAVAASSATASTTAALMTLRVPIGIKVRAKVTASMDNTSGAGCGGVFTSPDMADQAATGPLSQLRTRASASQSVELNLWTDTSGRLRHRESATSASVAIDASVIGWTDRRGRDD